MKEAIIQYNDTPSGGHMAISWKPLIRCKDCKYWHQDLLLPDDPAQKVFGNCGKVNGFAHAYDFYCADGERSDT